MTTVGYNIPLDLAIEILLRLPPKSLFRFRCVSKTWCSIIRSRQFADAFMSLSRPRLLFGLNPHCEDRMMFLFSSDQSYNFYSSSSSSTVAAKKSTLTISKIRSYDSIQQRNSVRGFVCCSLGGRFVVCNPNTRQVIVLPEDYVREAYMYLGYDQINDQYKLLRLKMRTCSSSPISHSVCTLGGERSSSSWRPIESSILYYECAYNGVCIDGVVYYEVSLEPYGNYMEVVGSFDVASEQIRLIKTPGKMVAHLANYRGKLAAYDSSVDDRIILWVLDDVKNQVWQKRVCVFSFITHSLLLDLHMRFAGITPTGEIVYFPSWTLSDPFDLFCYDVEKKVERRVRIEGLIGDINDVVRCTVSLSCSFVDNIIYL